MNEHRKRYWLTPPDVLEALRREHGPFDFDPCPHPVPPGFDGLCAEWGSMNYVNPPFRRHDSLDGQHGPTAFVHRAIQQHQEHGRGSVLVLPVQSYVMHLAAADAEIRSLGRVRWLDTATRKPCPSPSPICAFVLKAR